MTELTVAVGTGVDDVFATVIEEWKQKTAQHAPSVKKKKHTYYTSCTWGHPELLTFGETRNNRLNTFVPLYTLALRSMIPQNIDFKSNANMNA